MPGSTTMNNLAISAAHTADPLLSDDLPTLLRSFPNDALCDLVSVLKQHEDLSPFTDARASTARELPADGDFKAHAEAIAAEVLWWGSHDLYVPFVGSPAWIDVLVDTAKHLSVAESERRPPLPAWKVEDAIFRNRLKAWEQLTPAQREEAMTKAGASVGAVKGGVVAAAGGIAHFGSRQVALALMPRLGPQVAARIVGIAVGPVLAVLGAAWGAYDLAGPSYRALVPATLVIAFHRRRLREQRVASAFQD